MPSRRLAFQPSSDRTSNKSSAALTFHKKDLPSCKLWRNVFSGFGHIEVLWGLLPSQLRRKEPTSQVEKAFPSCLAL